MSIYSPATEQNLDRALLVLRLVLAAIFIAHGYQKLFTYGISGVTGSFAKIGAPAPSITAPLMAVLEFVGGIALLLGAFTRVAAFLLACEMLGAIAFVHAKNGFFLPNGMENALINLASLVAVALLGAGAYSVDALLAQRHSIAT